VKEPERERPFRGPGAIRIGGRELPLFALFGAFGTGSAFIVVSALNRSTLIFGMAWLALGIALYVAYRRNQGLSLVQTVKAVRPKPIVEREVEYESVLVAFEDSHYSPEALATAVKLAARGRRGIHVLVTITVPANLPIGASLPKQESIAQQTIDSARVAGGRRVTGHWEKVRPGEAGRRIVDEAELIKARAIVLPVVRRRRAAPVLGQTVEYVLASRPCRVIVESPPAAKAVRAGG
jgi:APA family basic amino acid/polyamine antiporter